MKTKPVVFHVKDIEGNEFGAEADFGVVIVGNKQFKDGKEIAPTIEVDYTLTKPSQLRYLLATALITAYQYSPKEVQAAINLLEEEKKQKPL